METYCGTQLHLNNYFNDHHISVSSLDVPDFGMYTTMVALILFLAGLYIISSLFSL